MVLRITPLKAIRTKCLECAGGRKAVKKCETANCALFSFKEGRNPRRKGIGRPGGNPLLNTISRLQYFSKKGIVEGDGNAVSAVGQKDG